VEINARTAAETNRLGHFGFDPQQNPLFSLQSYGVLALALALALELAKDVTTRVEVSLSADPSSPRPCYRGASLIRNRLPLGPYSRHMPRALWWS